MSPVTPPPTNPNQVGFQGSQPFTSQQNFGQLLGEVSFWNPDCPLPLIANIINNIARKIYCMRYFYGTMVRGQIIAPQLTVGGNVTLTSGSASVEGTGANFTAAVVGQQFRQSFVFPWYTITAVDVASQVLTLEMPWGGPTYVNTGYLIGQMYYMAGVNIIWYHSVTNLLQGWALELNMSQQDLNQIDPWRQQIYNTYAIAPTQPDVNGNLQVELYPMPLVQQTFPYWAYVQPPNLVNDLDSLPPFIRCDIVKAAAIAEVLLYGGKNSKYYNPQVAQMKVREFETEMVRLMNQDDSIYMRDSKNRMNGFAPWLDSSWNAMHIGNWITDPRLA